MKTLGHAAQRMCQNSSSLTPIHKPAVQSKTNGMIARNGKAAVWKILVAKQSLLSLRVRYRKQL
jgi:hypothetical protein